MSNEETIKRVREAIKDRATWFALLYRSFSKVLPPKEVERASREAIYEFGRLKGKKDGKKISPKEWVEKHMSKGSGEVFESKIFKETDYSEQRMTFFTSAPSVLGVGRVLPFCFHNLNNCTIHRRHPGLDDLVEVF